MTRNHALNVSRIMAKVWRNPGQCNGQRTKRNSQEGIDRTECPSVSVTMSSNNFNMLHLIRKILSVSCP